MNIPFYDLKLENKKQRRELSTSFKKTVENSSFILGKNVEEFEREWAKYLGVKYAVGVGNGTDALIIAIKACGIGSGDEVIIPAFTFVATSFAITLNGATPVFVDIDPKTHSIDVGLIEKAITKKTKAIIPVHLYGNPADMDKIIHIAKKHKLLIIEDAAQAHGAEYKKKKAGTMGHVGCFSFYPAKNLGALGDGGAVVTNNKVLYGKILKLRNYGQIKKYHSESFGFNSRLDEMQAGFLRIKLATLDHANKKRRKIVDVYKKELSTYVKFPRETENGKSCYHLFTIQLKSRAKRMKRLQKMGVSTLIHYPIPLHLQKAYKSLGYKKGDFPVSETIAETTVSLPLFPSMSLRQARYVISSVLKVL